MKSWVLSVIVLTGIVLFAPLAIAVERNVPSEYATIQAAINASSNGDVVIISPGTYTGTGNRGLGFLGKAITIRSTNPAEPGIVAQTKIDCQKLDRAFVLENSEGSNSIIKGISILNGQSQYGSGIYCGGASPTIEDCVISSCGMTGAEGSIGWDGERVWGGGLYCESDSHPTLRNCTFNGNYVRGGKGGPCGNGIPRGAGGQALGGAVCAIWNSSVYAENCSFILNEARGGDTYDGICGSPLHFPPGGEASGGAIYGQLTIVNCVVYNNTAIGGTDGYYGADGTGQGGGLYATADSQIKNCLIINNSANISSNYHNYGGGIYSGSANSVQIQNSSICNNTAYVGGGVYGNGATNIVNSIIWNNTDDLQGCSATFSCIKDPDPGASNIHTDPCFVSGGPNSWQKYFLAHTATGQTIDSPCVNAGSDMSDNLGMNLRSTRTDGFGDTGIADMGYHYTALIIVNSPDLNKDSFIDFIDYAIFTNDWLQPPDPCDPNRSDIIKNGWIDMYDLKEMFNNWLACFVTKAFGPVPDNNAICIDRTVILQWSPGRNCTSHDIYFGTDFNEVYNASIDNPAVYMGNINVNFWDTNNYYPNGLEPKTYYWRIDEIGPACAAKGDIWSFTKAVQASNPNPADTANDVSITQELSWTAGSGTISHDVYFGITNPPPFKVNQTGTTYDTGTMNTSTTYYWRIDERNGIGVATGDVWSFTTTDPNIMVGLVAWWKFDEGTGTLAYDSAGTNVGNIYGATWATGHINGALSFDGTNDYIYYDGSSASNNDNITVSAWMQTSTTGVLVSNRYTATGYGTWYMLSSTNIELGGNSSGNGYINLTFNTPTLDGKWRHVVYTKSGTNHAIYIDGSLDQQFTSNADISWNVPLYIGKRGTINASFFHGKIDDVRIYNRALSAEEAELLYQQGL